MLLWILGGLAYLATGYFLGKVANRILLNETPTEKLNLLRKIGRKIFFPVRSDEWSDRYECDGFFRWHWICSDKHRFNLSPKGLNEYCRITAFFWPLKVLPTIFAILSITWNAIEFLFELPVQFTERRKTKKNSRGVGAFSSLYITNIEEALAKLRIKKQEVEVRHAEFQKSREPLHALLSRIDRLISSGNESSAIRSSCDRALAVCTDIMNAEYDRLKKIEKALSEISDKKAVIEGYETVFRAYQNLARMNVNTDKEQREIIEAATLASEACDELLALVRRNETQALCLPGLDIPIEEIEAQIKEAVKEEERITAVRTAQLSVIH